MVEFPHGSREGNAITCTLTTVLCDPTDPINVSEMLEKLLLSLGGLNVCCYPRQLFRLTSEKGKPRMLWQLYGYSVVELFIQSKDILLHK